MQRLKMQNLTKAGVSALAGPNGEIPLPSSVPLSDPMSLQKMELGAKRSTRKRHASAGTDSNMKAQTTMPDSQRQKYCRDLQDAFLETVQAIPEGQARKTCLASTMLAGGTCLHLDL